MIHSSTSMEGGSSSSSSCRGYGEAPWSFKGRAVYQLHLVNSQLARSLIPKDFRLVEAFGYTLGGFFLANYDDSPAGVFDELVVIPGIVWNPPTSCAWASKVLVNSNAACLHGRTDVGLPSDVATFTKRLAADGRQQETKFNGFLRRVGLSCGKSRRNLVLETQVTEINAPSTSQQSFSINLLSSLPGENSQGWLGPQMKLSLPSFSGRTQHNPSLLMYSCQMDCRIRIVPPLQISKLSPTNDTRTEQQALEDQSLSSAHRVMEETVENTSNLSLEVMLSKPILAVEFNCLSMNVAAPLTLSE